MTLEFYKDEAGEYRWRLKADNHKIIAESGEGYHNEDDCKKGWHLTASAGDEFFWKGSPHDGSPDDVDLTVVHPCTVHSDDKVCEAIGREGCHS